MPFKFLFVSYDGLIGDIAWQVTKEGHEAKYYIEHAEEREITAGFVPQTTDWRADVDWADVIVFDDVLGHGTLAAELRRTGKKVVGGTPYCDRLEDDRGFGQAELKAAGVNIIPQQDFTSFDDAIAFVRANPNRYVIKPSGEAQNLKGLLFVGEEEDGRDVIEVLEDYKRAWANQVQSFQLQRRVLGVEVATGAFFNGREFVYPICVNFEHKKLFPGDIGPSTGEMGTAMFWSEPNKIFNQTLRKMEPALAREGYVGYIDVNCIVNANGVYPLEFTARFGYPTISIQQEGLLTPMGELLHGLACGTLSRVRARTGYQIGVRVVVPPLPVHRSQALRDQQQGRGDPVQDQVARGLPPRGRQARERRVARDRHLRCRADRLRHRAVHAPRAEAGLQPREERDDPEHVLPRGHRRPLDRGRQRPVARLGLPARVNALARRAC